MLLGLLLAAALALDVPAAPTARVNDYAGLLAPDERQGLERVIAERESATGAQMVIAIFRALDGGSLEDFSIRLAEQWRIGQKGLDNGVIFLVFVDDRRMRMEVGYGLEGVIPDIVAGRIISESVAPPFREQRYAAGLEAAVREVYSRVETGPQPGDRRKTTGLPPSVVGFVIIMAIIVLVLGFEASRSRRFVGRRGYTAGRGGWAGPIIFPGPGWGGRDSGWGGGGWSGGGGGRFGGGGASGSW